MTSNSALYQVTYGKKETEKHLLDALGIAVMRNSDGSVVLEIYGPEASRKAFRVRLSADDIYSQREAWRELGKASKPPPTE